METQLKPVPIETSQSTWKVPGAGATVALDQNSVIRNTYWLLALSMLPTVVGAYAGMSMNFAAMVGESAAGLSTTVLPVTSEATTRPAMMAHGKFQGGMMAPTPRGM